MIKSEHSKNSLLQRDIQLPNKLNNQLISCLGCRLVLQEDQFRQARECPNCHNPIDYEDDRTTSNFAGLIALIQPSMSWAARYQGMTKYKPGLYAIDARKEINMVKEQGLSDYDDFSTNKEASTVRNEREVKVKKEK